MEPPVSPEADRKIKMVYVTQGQSPRSDNDNIALLDTANKRDPYDKFAENDTRDAPNKVYGTQEQLAFLEDIVQVYNDIASHGIRKDPGEFTAIHRGDPLSPKFDQYVKSLPFTGKLEFSPEQQKPQETPLYIPSRYISNEERMDIARRERRAEIARREAEEIARQEAEDLPKIKELLSKPGVKDVLRKFSEKFNNEPGREFIHGITPDGLVVAVRENRENDVRSDDYFKAWVLDAKLPEDEIENKMISTSFSALYVDGYAGEQGGRAITYFPPIVGVGRHSLTKRLS